MKFIALSSLFLSMLSIIVACGDSEESQKEKEIPLEKLIYQYPDSAELYVRRGRISMEKRDFKQALSDGATAFRLDSTNAEVELFYADVINNNPLRSVEDIYVAQRHYESLLKKDDKNTDILVSLASTYSQQQDFDKAFTYINNALRIDPRYRDAYILKGSIYRVLGKTELMKSSYETAVQQDPEFHEAYIMLGVIYQQEKNPICIQYFETASALLPGNPEALYSLAYAKQHFGQEEEAREMYREMVKDTSDYYASQAYFQLGHFKQFYDGSLDSAMYFYNKAIYVEPRYTEAHHNLGMCYDKKGDKTKALQSFGKALKYNPDFTLSKMYADSIRFL